MPYCAHCGSQVPAAVTTCPRCGKVPSGAPPSAVVKGPSAGLAVVLIAVAVGGLFLVAAMGIVAALVIPNFVDALQKAKQKRTVADMREVGMAIVSYRSDGGGTLPQAQDLEELRPLLVPKYLPALPASDGWQRPFRYACWQDDPAKSGCDRFRIVSGGRDGRLASEDLAAYEEGTFEPTDYDQDIVFADGIFLRYPARAASP